MPAPIAIISRSSISVHSPHIAAIRGLAIIGVVQCHYLGLRGVYELFSIPAPLVETLIACGAGVDLFFVLSAFLLTRGLLSCEPGRNSALAFYRRRAFRILPAYWLLVASGFALAPLLPAGRWSNWLFDGAYSPLLYLAFLQNWQIGADGAWSGYVFAHSWSLAVEEQFYLVIPLVVMAMTRRRLALLAGLAIVSGPAIRLLIGEHMPVQAVYCWPIARMDAFGWGVLAAILACERPDLVARLPARALAVGSMALFAALAAFAHTSTRTSVEALSLYLAPVDGLAAVLVLAAAAMPAGSRLEQSAPHRWLVWAGERCYSIYLFHNAFFGLAMVAVENVAPTGGALAHLVATLVALVCLLAFADLCYRFIEQPFIALGRRERVTAARWAPAG